MKGIYLLVIAVLKDKIIRIGALGKIRFPKGIYVYVGSGQNVIEKRIQRHLAKNKKKYWHIDYLLDNKDVKIVDVFYKRGKKQEECKTVNKLMQEYDFVSGFGCSDCKCKSHLLYLQSLKLL